MKLFIFILLQYFVVNVEAQQISIKKNTILHYQVKTDAGETYLFDVKVSKFGAAGIKFTWEMIFTNNKSNGTVTIYKAALETATAYRNYFANKSNVQLTKESTVWMSKKNYKDLIAQKESSLSLDFNIQNYKWAKNTAYSASILGKTTNLSAFEIKSTTTDNYLIILKEENNPLILKMKPKDFTIYLTSVEQK